MALRKGLGKGLGALFEDNDFDLDLDEPARKKAADGSDGRTESAAAPVAGKDILEIPVSKVFPNVHQPRKNFDPDAMKELADSVRLHGIIAPIVAVKKNGGYMIIAGERRYRAAVTVGLETVPVIVKEYNEQKIKEVSLVENLQREDLNAIEAAAAIKQLMKEFGFTQEDVADRLGKSRSAIANTLRLLSLCPAVIEMITANRLSAGHARCLIPVADVQEQTRLAAAACDNRISVRDLERAVKNFLEPKKTKTREAEPSLELQALISDMQRVFATKVHALGNDRKGRIYIDYFSKDDLERIYDMIEKLKLVDRWKTGENTKN